MRYFYTDPLKAAWMRKEFNFQLLGNSTFEQYEPSDRWEVRLESYEQLKPQVGDLIIQRGNICQNDKIGTVTHITKDGQCACYADYMNDAGAHEGSVVHMIFGKKAEIIQRNGKAFFMPEEEKLKEDKN